MILSNSSCINSFGIKAMPDEEKPWKRHRDDDDDSDDGGVEREDEEERPRRRRRREFDEERRDESNSLAVVGLVFGLLSFCTSCLAGIPAIICSAIAMNRPGKRGMALAGLIMGLLGTLLSVPVLIGLLLPAVAKVRGAAQKATDSNNLMQIALATHNDASDNDSKVYAPYAHDKKGNLYKGLSFRVSLLPYMEQGSVYKQFDLKEEWDSKRNYPYSNTIIKSYTTPYDKEVGPNTHYRAFVGGGALFEEDGSPVSMLQVTDGLSNTIMYVHAAEQVPWAKPQELIYSPKSPLPALGSPGMSGGTIVAMGDGSVHFIKSTVSERTLRALITRAGNERIDEDW
jgi:hypothetical protein